MAEKVYLGDAVYAERLEGGKIKLTTEIELDVLKALLEFVGHLCEHPKCREVSGPTYKCNNCGARFCEEHGTIGGARPGMCWVCAGIFADTEEAPRG